MPESYPALIADLIPAAVLPPLGPGEPSAAYKDRLSSLRVETAFAPHVFRDPDMAACFLAGLWLFHNFLDESHRISQEIETPTGSYWHGVMHRREPDASNAGYWFRRVGKHPIFEPLHQDALAFGLKMPGRYWDPFYFIDLCEKHRGADSAEEMLLRRAQRREWELLSEYCFRQAIGGK
jgi:hypothetical protein